MAKKKVKHGEIVLETGDLGDVELLGGGEWRLSPVGEAPVPV